MTKNGTSSTPNKAEWNRARLCVTNIGLEPWEGNGNQKTRKEGETGEMEERDIITNSDWGRKKAKFVKLNKQI